MERSSVTGHQGLLEGTVDIYRVGQQRRLQSGKVMCHQLPAVDQLRAVHLGRQAKVPLLWDHWQGEERTWAPITLATCVPHLPTTTVTSQDTPPAPSCIVGGSRHNFEILKDFTASC